MVTNDDDEPLTIDVGTTTWLPLFSLCFDYDGFLFVFWADNYDGWFTLFVWSSFLVAV